MDDFTLQRRSTIDSPALGKAPLFFFMFGILNIGLSGNQIPDPEIMRLSYRLKSKFVHWLNLVCIILSPNISFT